MQDFVQRERERGEREFTTFCRERRRELEQRIKVQHLDSLLLISRHRKWLSDRVPNPRSNPARLNRGVKKFNFGPPCTNVNRVLFRVGESEKAATPAHMNAPCVSNRRRPSTRGLSKLVLFSRQHDQVCPVGFRVKHSLSKCQPLGIIIISGDLEQAKRALGRERERERERLNKSLHSKFNPTGGRRTGPY